MQGVACLQRLSQGDQEMSVHAALHLEHSAAIPDCVSMEVGLVLLGTQSKVALILPAASLWSM